MRSDARGSKSGTERAIDRLARLRFIETDRLGGQQEHCSSSALQELTAGDQLGHYEGRSVQSVVPRPDLCCAQSLGLVAQDGKAIRSPITDQFG